MLFCITEQKNKSNQMHKIIVNNIPILGQINMLKIIVWYYSTLDKNVNAWKNSLIIFHFDSNLIIILNSIEFLKSLYLFMTMASATESREFDKRTF